MQSVYDEFSAFSYVAYWRDAIATTLFRTKGCLSEQLSPWCTFSLECCSPSAAGLTGSHVMWHNAAYTDRNKEHSKYELVSGSGPFWAGLAELCTVAHFVYTACWMEIMISNQGIDICVGRPLLWCVP